MPRGRGFASTPRGYRGSSNRGNSSWNGNSSRGGGGYSGSSRYNSFSSLEPSRSPYDQKSSKYFGSADRFSRSDDYHRPSYRSDYNTSSSSFSRERRSPDRKRMRMEAPSSRHEPYYGSSSSSRYEPSSSYSERRLSSDRHHTSPFSRREEFRRPSGPPKRGNYRGRLSSRGSRGLRTSDRPLRRRLIDSSYMVRKRLIPRISDYSRRLKISRMRSAVVARRGIKRSTKSKDESDEEKDEENKPTEEKGDKDEEEEEKKSGDEKEKTEDDEEKKRKSFIKLHCPQCGLKALTFRKYENHLHGRLHLLAMRKVALKQKAILIQMRQAQRNTQNELEKSSDDLGTRTNFCPLCKLNYKQKRAVHQLSESHQNMKKFLMPFCKVCNISFKSPMIYENHCCSIDHIKRKQRMATSSDGSAEEDNLENFTTIDSVGDVDGEGSEIEEKKDEDNDKEEGVNVGIEKIRKIEAFYCDLCKMYLQRGDDTETPKILSRHCKQRVHMQRYIRMKESQELEKRAEKLQRQELAEKEEKGKDDEVEGIKEKKGQDEDETKDDKLWADVDKDLGDILAEAESGNKSSDEDEDSHVNGERYDRFKLSEKNGEEKLMGADEEGILDNKLVINDGDDKQ